LNTARGIAVWLALVAYRLARCALALLGLASVVGDVWAALLIVLAAAAGFNWLLRVAAWFALMRLWHWPWPLAAIAVVPRLVLLLPGLIATVVARLRHPRPLWTAPVPLAAPASAGPDAPAAPRAPAGPQRALPDPEA
jgi:hypothetical protein